MHVLAPELISAPLFGVVEAASRQTAQNGQDADRLDASLPESAKYQVVQDLEKERVAIVATWKDNDFVTQERVWDMSEEQFCKLAQMITANSDLSDQLYLRRNLAKRHQGSEPVAA